MFKKEMFQNQPFPAETQHLEEETCWLSFSSFSPPGGGGGDRKNCCAVCVCRRGQY